MKFKAPSKVLILAAAGMLAAGVVNAGERSARWSHQERSHRADIDRFVGSWKVTHSATTSACQDGFVLEHPDPSTITRFNLDYGDTSDLKSDDGDCSFTWYVQDRELRAQAGQFCNQDLPDGSQVQVGLIYAHGTLQPDGSAKDSIFISVTLDPKEGESRTCLVTIEETLVLTGDELPSMVEQGKKRNVPKSKYAETMTR